jgi:hypothetical protein
MHAAQRAHLARFIGIGACIAAIISLFLTGLASTATAQNTRGIDRYLKRYQRIQMDLPSIAHRARTMGRLTLPTEDGMLELSVVPNDIRAPGYRAEAVDADGVIRPVFPERIRTFRGTAPEIPGSEVRFSLRDDSLEGIVITPQAWYLVEPMNHYDASAAPDEMVVYRATDIVPESFGTCATALAERISHEVVKVQQMIAPQTLQASSISIADVATEADYEFVAAYGSAAAANNEILDIMNQVDGIYRSQLSISLRVIYQHAWASSADPYSSTAPGTMLTEFRSWGAGNLGAVPYDIAHMWTGKDMDGSTIGIAYVGVTCYYASYTYGVSQNFSASPGKYILTAHEIGHNFGASHTDEATPAQPDCTNTIMNSYVGTGTTFCAYSKNEINAHVSQYNACMATTSGNCDINSDSQTNVLDLQSLVNAILGSDVCPGTCDINKDSGVNALDLQLESNVILGSATCP